jgi:hypothetical protein
MPGVHNSKRAKRICNGAARGGERISNIKSSRFVLIVLFTIGAYLGPTTVKVRRLTLAAEIEVALPLKRASVVAANVADTKRASSPQSCRRFQQA